MMKDIMVGSKKYGKVLIFAKVRIYSSVLLPRLFQLSILVTANDYCRSDHNILLSQ